MRYGHVVPGVFLERPNRFIARVEIGGRAETVHVKNTGRCRELLVPGCEVWLDRAENPARRTGWDLVAVRKSTGVLFNIDSQAPNKVVREWLERRDFTRILPEYRYDASRMDFYMERGPERFLLEVKGCTLEMDGVGYFPDAPTERGTRHLRELIRAKNEGYRAQAAFVVQMEGVTEVRANGETDPAFARALEDARGAGVEILTLRCRVEPDKIEIAE